uniref:transmembrane domain-containing protein TMIGD3-like n=1 Tax=Semicossyphus pulcher TaxID=241346 RepID=UPI0037E81B6C
MEKISFVVVFLLGGLWEAQALAVTGVLGETIKITCSHSYAFSNVKYFCKGACKDKDVLISSRKMKTDSNGKYSIEDKGNTFYVDIFQLTEDDSGTYWCGIERTGVDTYNKVVLTVKKGEKKEPEKSFPRSIANDAVNTTSSKKLVYIGAGLGVVVLALAIVLLIFFIHRKRGGNTSSEKVQETVYATLSDQKQDGGNTSPSSHTNEAKETDKTSRDLTDNIYSNVTASSEPQIQPDGLFYSTVSFTRHTDCRA